MADGRQNRKTAISPQWFKRLTWAAAVSRGIPRICRSDLRNLANGAAEFGKICRGKLWAPLMLSIQAMRGRPHLRAPGIVPCIISFSRQTRFLMV